MKMHHTAYIELNETLVREYYKNDDYKTYKRYRLIAIDGSKMRLPNNKEIIREFGVAQNKEVETAMAMNSTAYDVLNKIAINTCLDRCKMGERSLVKKHMEKIQEITPNIKNILLMDRGYPAIYLFVMMLQKDFDFVIRCTDDGFIKEAREFAKGEVKECIIEISLKGRTRYNSKSEEYISKTGQKRVKIRIVKILLKTGKEEFLITSLLDKSEFTLKDLEELYHLRWDEETYFDFQKNVFEAENFSGRSPEAIRQDFYARILSSNISTLIIEDAQEVVDKQMSKKKGLKYEEYKVNKSVAIGLMKSELIEILLLSNNRWEKRYNTLVKRVKKHIIPVIPDRSFPREKRVYGKYYLRRRKVI